MIKYSLKAAKTVALFFRYKNEIDIYYEDSNDNEFYAELFKRLLPEKPKIGKLISLGNKSNVIEACENDQADKERKRLYVVDGDIHLVLDANRKDLKYLHVLNAYCIENLLIEEDCIVEILHDSFGKSRDDIKKALTFEKWLKGITPSMIDLFLNYAIVFQYNLPIATISNNVERLCQVKKALKVLDSELVTNEITRIKLEILKTIPEDQYDQSLYDLKQKWPHNIETLLKIVSGKDYLLPLVHLRMFKVMGKNSNPISRESLRLRMLKNNTLSKFAQLKNHILEVA